jgi:CubicO group peptidase (beta-lactamase class C family)
MKAYHETGKFNGYVYIAGNDGVIYSNGFGISDAGKKQGLIFPIMSLTKQFTSVIILKLLEEGKLRLDEPFVSYLRQYKQEKWKTITIHQLLSHSSGLPDYIGAFDFYGIGGQEKLYHSPDTLINAITAKDMNFKPGEKFQYCNANYVLLGMVIEKLTAMSLQDALSRYITLPLKLTHTGYELGKLPKTTLARSYYRENGNLLPSRPLHLSIPWAGGGMYSTAADLFRFQEALFKGKLLKPETVNKMYQPYKPVDDTGFLKTFKGYEGSSYGYGVFVKKIQVDSSNAVLSVSAPGLMPFGFINNFIYLPDFNLYVLTVENSNQYFFPDRLLSVLLNK